VISSRPYGTCRPSNFYPGLRPGLNSAVPTGLDNEVVVVTPTLKLGSCGQRFDLCEEERGNVPQGLKAEWFCRVYVRAKARTYPPYLQPFVVRRIRSVASPPG